jgi:methyl-accepting chemotaxis protein
VKVFALDTISKKFVVPTSILTILLLGGLGVYMALNNNASVLSMMDSRGRGMAEFISNISKEHISNSNLVAVEQLARDLMRDPEVAFAVFYDANGKPITKDNSGSKGSASVIVYEHGIKDFRGSNIGKIRIGYYEYDLENSLKNNILIASVGVVTAVALLTLGIILLVRIVITKRVHDTVNMLKDIARGEGDLTKRLNEQSKDELGELARWFNTFIENLRDMIVEIKTNIDNIASSSTELSVTADDVDRGTKEQSSQTEQVASAMTEMSQTIVDVAKNAGDSAEASQEASGLAGKGKDVVEKTVQGMLKIAETVRDTSSTIESLGTSSAEIGNIINTINEIAEQTNLLALNAAIEAARAGEQGRGFAVVADEVRKLAERTGKATSEIAEMIEKIQDETKKSVISMESGRDEVDYGVTLSEEAKDALDNIVSASQKAVNMVQMIAAASEQQSAAAEEVSSNMENILYITKATSNAIGQISTASDDLARLSSDLQSRIGLFKV